MSELVEKVARAMCLQSDFNPDEVMSNDGPLWRYYVPQASYAIAAVAEWMMSKDGDMLYSGQRLQKQLEQPK